MASILIIPKPVRVALATAAVLCVTSGHAAAATATFVEPARLAPADAAALSTAGDGAGFLLGLNSVLAILFDAPFGLTRGEAVSVVTLGPSSGTARATVRYGQFNGGSPVFFDSRIVNAGNAVTFNNIFQRGCSAFGGCDYIEIITTRTNGGAQGVEIDYVSVNGEVTEIVATAPEPATWGMMIAGFVFVAWRLKALRRGSRAAFQPIISSASSP